MRYPQIHNNNNNNNIYIINMKGIYLAACTARHPNYNIIYQDIDKSCNPDIDGDMLETDLTPYDYIIATPPCNYYSRANYRRNKSSYALNTKHLLPTILDRLGKQNKPFIIENVRNATLFKENKIFDIANKNNTWIYYVGRHTYFTNIFFNPTRNQERDHVTKISYTNKNRQGSKNVHEIIEFWLKYIHQM